MESRSLPQNPKTPVDTSNIKRISLFVFDGALQVSVDLWEQVHSKVGGDGVELDRVAVQLAIELLHVLWLLLVLLLELQYLFELY